MYIVYPHFTRLFKPSKKDKDSVEGKGHRCGLGDIIVSILTVQAILHQDDLKNGMIDSFLLINLVQNS